jgi:tRNA A37 threonylcarbamoyladenosine synthetase subunit TsaC/SUA5/YrdC
MCGVEEISKLIEVGPVILPTDTVYGLFCLESQDRELLYEAKHRPLIKKLALYVPQSSLIFNWIPKGKIVTHVEGGLAYRVLSEKAVVLNYLLEHLGPMWGTSANISGEPATHQATDIKLEVPIFVPLFQEMSGRPSSVISGKEILRE